jgi:hypothetical protein
MTVKRNHAKQYAVQNTCNGKPIRFIFVTSENIIAGRDLRATVLAVARRSLAGGGEKLHLEVNLNSQVNRCGLSIEDRWFIFSF